jgi:transposase
MATIAPLFESLRMLNRQIAEADAELEKIVREEFCKSAGSLSATSTAHFTHCCKPWASSPLTTAAASSRGTSVFEQGQVYNTPP